MAVSDAAAVINKMIFGESTKKFNFPRESFYTP